MGVHTYVHVPYIAVTEAQVPTVLLGTEGVSHASTCVWHVLTCERACIVILQEKIDYGALIQDLGGEYIDQDYFTTRSTHLIVGELCSWLASSCLPVPISAPRVCG